MPDKKDPPKTDKTAPDLKKLTDPQVKQSLATDLNIVLSKEQIKKILQDLIDVNAFTDPGSIASKSEYCCVDVVISSSVAGPVSSIGSSVSVDPSVRTLPIEEKLNAEQIKVNLMVPRDVKIK